MLKFFTQADKLLHILVCHLITLYVWAFFFAFGISWWGFVLGNTVALGCAAWREYYGYIHPDKSTFEWLDLVADLIGIVSADIPILFIMLNQLPG